MSIGFWQVVLILLIVLIIFGAGKLPKVMGDVAKGIKSFRAGMKEDEGAASAEGEPKPIAGDSGSPATDNAAPTQRDGQPAQS